MQELKKHLKTNPNRISKIRMVKRNNSKQNPSLNLKNKKINKRTRKINYLNKKMINTILRMNKDIKWV
jgi:hypothetical protein